MCAVSGAAELFSPALDVLNVREGFGLPAADTVPVRGVLVPRRAARSLT
jgi:hypothetical protein